MDMKFDLASRLAEYIDERDNEDVGLKSWDLLARKVLKYFYDNKEDWFPSKEVTEQIFKEFFHAYIVDSEHPFIRETDASVADPFLLEPVIIMGCAPFAPGLNMDGNEIWETYLTYGRMERRKGQTTPQLLKIVSDIQEVADKTNMDYDKKTKLPTVDTVVEDIIHDYVYGGWNWKSITKSVDNIVITAETEEEALEIDRGIVAIAVAIYNIILADLDGQEHKSLADVLSSKDMPEVLTASIKKLHKTVEKARDRILKNRAYYTEST